MMQSKRGEANACVSALGGALPWVGVCLIIIISSARALPTPSPTRCASCHSCSGVRLKTRKRNIVVPHDPQSFADAVIDVIADAQESEDIVQTLAAANKVLDSAELDFNRYGEVLFEVAFAGARLASGGSTAVEGKKLPFNVSMPLCTRPLSCTAVSRR